MDIMIVAQDIIITILFGVLFYLVLQILDKLDKINETLMDIKYKKEDNH